MRTHTLALVDYQTRQLWDQRDSIKTAINGWITPAMVVELVPMVRSTVSKALLELAERGDFVRERTLNPPVTDGNVAYGYAPAEAVETESESSAERRRVV